MGSLLIKYEDIFFKNDWKLGLTHLSEHSIDTHLGMHRLLIKDRLAHAKEEQKVIENLLKVDVIRKNTSPWASLIILVSKKSGTV